MNIRVRNIDSINAFEDQSTAEPYFSARSLIMRAFLVPESHYLSWHTRRRRQRSMCGYRVVEVACWVGRRALRELLK